MRAGLATVCIAPLVLAGCLEPRTNRPLGERCSSGEECSGSLVCVYGRCRSRCRFDRDCEGEGATCIPADDGLGRVCWYPEHDVVDGGDGGTGCPGSAEFLDGACREPCAEDGGCEDLRGCYESPEGSYCVDPSTRACTAGTEPTLVPGSERVFPLVGWGIGAHPAIAWGGGIWAVAVIHAPGDPGLYCHLLDPDGEPLGGGGFSYGEAETSYSPPALLADEDGAVMVSIEQDVDGTARVRYVRVGDSLDNEVLDVLLGPEPRGLGIAAIGGHFAISWLEGSAETSSLWAAPFSTEGPTALGQRMLSGAPEVPLEAVVAGGSSGYGIAYRADGVDGVHLGFFDADSDLGVLAVSEDPPRAGEGQGLDLAWGGTGWGVALSLRADPGPGIFFHELDDVGTDMGRTVTVTDSVGEDSRPALAWGEGDAAAAIAWEAPTGGGTEVRLAVVHRGAESPSPEIVVGSGGRSPDVAFDGSRYGIVWIEGAVDPGELHFALVDSCP